MLYTDKDNAVGCLIWMNYNIFIINSGHGFVSVTSGSLNTEVAFVLIDLLCFLMRICINDLTALNH
jgi:hypothetical protein